MDNRLTPKYTWSDQQLATAVRTASHWRGVLRGLGIATYSEGVLRRVRRDVARLGLDVSHFRGTRSWNDAQLTRAVADARTWDDVLTSLGINDPGKETRARLKGHAVRLGLDLSHLAERDLSYAAPSSWPVDLKHLRGAAPSMAATWFTLRGCVVSMPLEPATYDLLAHTPEGISRVQVKTTTVYSKDGWMVRVGRRPYSAGNTGRLAPYDPDVIDFFFIIDGDLTMYLIPSQVIAGKVALVLHTYRKYAVGSASGLLAGAGTPTVAA